jgi:ankyrin repeat protein
MSARVGESAVSETIRSVADDELADDELFEAVERGDLEHARLLLRQGASPHEDSWGMNLLDAALARDDEQMTRLLVEHGARLDETDERHQTRLHRGARGCNDGDGVALLLRLGLDPNAPDIDGWTPLHHAAVQGYGEVVSVLLGAGADPEALTTGGQRAADLAAVNGHDRLPL